MAWQDRDYNQGGGPGDYLSNPAAILGLSVPFGTWLGVRVRLHFWLLLTFAFCLASLFRGGSPVIVVLYIALMLVALLAHDFGHRAFSGWVGGELNEFMFWPAGGMIFPTVPPGAWPMFVAHIGGMAVNFLLATGSYFAYHLLTGDWFPVPIDPTTVFGAGVQAISIYIPGHLLPICLLNFALLNWGLVLINVLPYFWFDGGFLVQSILRPFLGGATALNITCIMGMVLAVPMFAVSLVHESLMALVFWTFLFMSAYNARNTMPVESEPPAGTGWRSRRWAQSDFNRAAAKRRRQEHKIDAILAKVSAKGMHSLTWWEKRTLRKGSRSLK
jgi:hypothetical protein